MRTNIRENKAMEEREYCKVVLFWTALGAILGLLVWNVLSYLAMQDSAAAPSLAATEFVITGIFYTAAMIVEPIILARRA